jgi:hypothetical protein
MPRGRVASSIRRVERKIQIPEALDTELQLLLMSDIEQRVPYGALTKLVVPLLERFLTEFKENQRREQS